MKPLPTKDRFLGCLLGGAVGDALGAPVEFHSLERIRKERGEEGVMDYVEYPGNFGEFTDDTQMTLFTAEGLLHVNPLSLPNGMAGSVVQATWQAYARWLYTQEHCWEAMPVKGKAPDTETSWLIREKDLYHWRAPGTTCLESLRSGIPGTIAEPLNDSKGCGGIMRMAPAGLMISDPEQAFQTGCELAALTHGHPSGYLSAGAFAAIISLLLRGEELENAIEASSWLLQKHSGHEQTLDAIKRALDLFNMTKYPASHGRVDLPARVKELGEGFTGEEALSISLFCCLHHREDFRKGVLLSVNHSGDSDSTGSITGNFLGLINGIGAIPESWINNLRYADIVGRIAGELFELKL